MLFCIIQGLLTISTNNVLTFISDRYASILGDEILQAVSALLLPQHNTNETDDEST